MSESLRTRVPAGFKIAMILAVVWNLLGVMAFISIIMITPETLAQMSEAEQALHNTTPLWANIAFGCAVFGGFLGSLALLLRKTLAQPLLKLSLAAVIVQMFHAFFISNSWEVFGPGGLIMPIMVIVVAISLVWSASVAKRKAWLY